MSYTTVQKQIVNFTAHPTYPKVRQNDRKLWRFLVILQYFSYSHLVAETIKHLAS